MGRALYFPALHNSGEQEWKPHLCLRQENFPGRGAEVRKASSVLGVHHYVVLELQLQNVSCRGPRGRWSRGASSSTTCTREVKSEM